MSLPSTGAETVSRAYRHFDIDRRSRHARVGCILALILMPAGALLDHFVYPEHFWDILKIRLAADLFIIPVLVLLSTPFGRRHINIFGSLWAIVCALAISWMIYLTQGSSSPYYAGLNLVILVTCNLMPYTMLDAAAVCGITIGLYTLAIVLHGPPLVLRDVFNNYYFLVLTAIISVTACGVFDRGRREDFRLRHQLDQQNSKLNESYTKLEELDRLRSQFYANISHELRTPLTLILAPVEDILRSGHQLPDRVAEAIGIARINALRLLKLINDLLEVVRVDQGTTTLRREVVDLSTAAPAIVESIRMLAEAQGLTLTVIGDTTPLLVLADLSRIEKVLLNLLTNAIKFTPAGGGIIVSYRAMGQQLHLEITDTGVGIPEHELPFIFDRFRQVDGSSTRTYQGAGIGLALVRELILEHKGSITVRSSLGKGTCMSVRLPLVDAAQPAARPNGAEAPDLMRDIYRHAERRGGIILQDTVPVKEMAPVGLAGGRTIQVVDDEPDMRRYLVSRLVDHYRVLQSDHGVEAVDLARRERPDLIILDLMLPGLDGLSVCRALREDPVLRDTKIILLTARTDEESKLAALRCGADDFLTKPFSTLEVTTRIEILLRNSELQRTLSKRADELESTLARLKETEASLVQSEKMSALGTIAAGLLHEVNNPLNFTMTALQVALRRIRPDDAEVREVLEDIGLGMRRVKDIVSDLGMFAFKSSTADSERFAIRSVIDSAMRLSSHELVGIEIALELAADRDVSGSRTQLIHVFINLLVNSARALRPVLDRPLRITISSVAVGQRLRIAVRDCGTGIPEHVLPRIFEPFFTTRAVGQGMGLGLSICHTIVANHGGTITATSFPGHWTEIVFDLGLAPAQPPVGGDAAPAASSSAVSSSPAIVSSAAPRPSPGAS